MACEEKGLEAGVSPSEGHMLERPRQAGRLEVVSQLPYPVLLPLPSRNYSAFKGLRDAAPHPAGRGPEEGACCPLSLRQASELLNQWEADVLGKATWAMFGKTLLVGGPRLLICKTQELDSGVQGQVQYQVSRN